MLTPEQKTALMNAKALIAEIESMDAGENTNNNQLEEAYMAMNEEQQMGEQPEGEDIEQEESGENEANKKMVKSKVVKDTTTIGTPDASTASDDAEERIEDQPEQSKENIDEVAKALARALKALGGKNVKKSQNTTDAKGLTEAIVGLTNAVNIIQKSQNQQRAVLNDIMEGLGMAKAVEQNYNTGVQKSQIARQRPVQTTDTNEVLKEVTKALNNLAAAQNKTGQNEEPTEGNSGLVRKSLAENLEAFFQ